MMFSDVQKIINDFQDSGNHAYGSHAGHAWANGFLGATLADVLYYHVPAAHRDYVLKQLELYTKRNLEKESA